MSETLNGSRGHVLMKDGITPARPASYDKKVGLVLQGGGRPWQLSRRCLRGAGELGISAGLGGRHLHWRDQRRTNRWQCTGASGAAIAHFLGGDHGSHQCMAFCARRTIVEWQQWAGALTALMFGQPGFFEPRDPHDWLLSNTSVSYYKTSALKSTLERLIDFDRINHAKEMRLSVGAVNVRTGHFDYFDSEKITIRPEHVMASGAIPPGFPPIEIDGEHYWDGGLFSNTPLAYMVDYYPRRSRLILQVDVFPAHGRVPTNLAEVTERDKDVRYSSRTRLTTNNLREKHNVRHAINELHKLLPPELAATEQAQRLYAYGCVTEMDIVQLIYRPMEPLCAFKDF